MVRWVRGSPQQLVKSEGNRGGGRFPAKGAHQISLQGVFSAMLQKLIYPWQFFLANLQQKYSVEFEFEFQLFSIFVLQRT